MWLCPHREKLQERLAKLSGGIAVIKVRARTFSLYDEQRSSRVLTSAQPSVALWQKSLFYVKARLK